MDHSNIFNGKYGKDAVGSYVQFKNDYKMHMDNLSSDLSLNNKVTIAIRQGKFSMEEGCLKVKVKNRTFLGQYVVYELSFKSLLMRSYAEFDYAKKAIELGVSDYLLKPVSEEKIRSSIEKVSREFLEARKVEETLRKNQEDANVINNYLLGDSGKNYYVKISLEKIRDHFAERISIESVAEELGVSASYLSRKFKETTNHTFLELLNEHRIQQSVKLLSTGRYRVSEIGEKVGFNEYKHFYAVFKKHTGLTPSDFIK